MDSAVGFDLQAHRGGLAEWTEESIAAFTHAIELGVSTLELDTIQSADGKIMVWHDDRIQGVKCRDTSPVFEGDPQFPYVGKRVSDLTLAQLSTLNCGYQKLPGHPDQKVAQNNRIAQLGDVFSLVKNAGAEDIRFNIETKVEVGKAGSLEMKILTQSVLSEIEKWGMEQRVSLQSFDWGSLNFARQRAAEEKAPTVPLVALSGDEESLGVNKPGKKPELGGIDIDDFDGSLVLAADSLGYDAISPSHASVTSEMIKEAHERGLKVIPWTVDDLDDMDSLLAMGVDGIITNCPTRLRGLMEKHQMSLPKPYPALQ